MINWYPGHMTKSMRMIEDNLRVVDVILYVLDARAPYSCINPNFESMIAGMPVVYALNKSELGDLMRIKEWATYLRGENRTSLSLSAVSGKCAAPLLRAVRDLCAGKIEKYRNKGVRTSIKCMVLGVPNTGKSTVINSLCGSAKTITGNKAGVTRGKQWVHVNEWLDVLDTPGTLYPKLSDQRIARRLAYIGSIKDEIVDTMELAIALADELDGIDPRLLGERYGVLESGEKCIDGIAKSRGYLLRGGVPDRERAANALVDDFRRGKLGRVTLDSVSEL